MKWERSVLYHAVGRLDCCTVLWARVDTASFTVLEYILYTVRRSGRAAERDSQHRTPDHVSRIFGEHFTLGSTADPTLQILDRRRASSLIGL